MRPCLCYICACEYVCDHVSERIYVVGRISTEKHCLPANCVKILKLSGEVHFIISFRFLPGCSNFELCPCALLCLCL